MRKVRKKRTKRYMFGWMPVFILGGLLAGVGVVSGLFFHKRDRGAIPDERLPYMSYISEAEYIKRSDGIYGACEARREAGKGKENELELPLMTESQWKKGYDLPVEEKEREEAKKECLEIMRQIAEVYKLADKGGASNAVISEETMLRMKEMIKDCGFSVIGSESYSPMEHYQKIEEFLLNCQQGKAGAAILYEVYWSGGIGRLKYGFDGADMYVLSSNAVWRSVGDPMVSYISCARIKEWEYLENGWFRYELCVPEPPEVTEIVNGSYLVRVKPRSDECRQLSEKCVLPLGYQGNNLLCSNWSADHMEYLDYNGLYEYLYRMKYGERFCPGNDLDGIPAEEFESVIMAYLPISVEQIREWAVFDEEMQTYSWANLGCGNYAPAFFGTSVPEVIQFRENEDGTVTLTVEAVCPMVIGDEAVITHELTVLFADDGSFQYLGNKILYDGIRDIPEYQYRVKG